jgi:hypothetical protein
MKYPFAVGHSTGELTHLNDNLKFLENEIVPIEKLGGKSVREWLARDWEEPMELEVVSTTTHDV